VAAADDPEGLEQTMLAVRSRPRWYLVTGDGTKLALTGDTVVLGRSPSADPAEPGVQLLAVPDSTRTISKRHARLELAGGSWRITDLGSTNGVTLIDPDGTERGLGDSGPRELTRHFYLGDAELRLVLEGSGA
jgi:predicted component of type VI protein secretion system